MLMFQCKGFFLVLDGCTCCSIFLKLKKNKKLREKNEQNVNDVRKQKTGKIYMQNFYRI